MQFRWHLCISIGCSSRRGSVVTTETSLQEEISVPDKACHIQRVKGFPDTLEDLQRFIPRSRVKVTIKFTQLLLNIASRGGTGLKGLGLVLAG